jgi:hypothetical protein
MVSRGNAFEIGTFQPACAERELYARTIFSVTAMVHVAKLKQRPLASLLEDSHTHHRREAFMRKLNVKSLMNALLLTSAFGFFGVTDALAQKKISYEKAWADCKQQIDRTVPGDQASARTSAGAACMKKHGYRLKKSS